MRQYFICIWLLLLSIYCIGQNTYKYTIECQRHKYIKNGKDTTENGKFYFFGFDKDVVFKKESNKKEEVKYVIDLQIDYSKYEIHYFINKGTKEKLYLDKEEYILNYDTPMIFYYNGRKLESFGKCIID